MRAAARDLLDGNAHVDRTAPDAGRGARTDRRFASASLGRASRCTGLSLADRDTSPFEHEGDVAAVEPLVEHVTTGYGVRTETVGAIVTFRAVPGMTAPRLQRMVDCHLARNAALGHVVPEMPDCPLVPRGATARVRLVGSSFTVEIRGDDLASARAILARAERLVRRQQAAVP